MVNLSQQTRHGGLSRTGIPGKDNVMNAFIFYRKPHLPALFIKEHPTEGGMQSFFQVGQSHHGIQFLFAFLKDPPEHFAFRSKILHCPLALQPLTDNHIFSFHPNQSGTFRLTARHIIPTDTLLHPSQQSLQHEAGVVIFLPKAKHFVIFHGLTGQLILGGSLQPVFGFLQCLLKRMNHFGYRRLFQAETVFRTDSTGQQR